MVWTQITQIYYELLSTFFIRYSEPSQFTFQDVSIELSESNTGNGLGMKNPVFSEPDDI